MKKEISLLQTYTNIYYHTIPGELKMITLSPEREAIFNHLAQIDYARFPEFIQDVLVLVEGHKRIDITDGTGDEKQDILTETPTGERQLTQCKHTEDYKEHTSGDELDLLLGACFRKNCTKGLYATNADLTPQAKRYINDKEYVRGWSGPKDLLPEIDYWNSTRIWERISRHNDILNKWFSGMGQAHGIRHFSFDLVIRHMPTEESPSLRSADISKTLENKAQVHTLEGKQTFTVFDKINFTLSDWFRSDLDLGVEYVGAASGHHLVNIPLWTLRVQLTISKDAGQYDPRAYRDSVVKFIADTALPLLKENEWWYLVATPAHASIFLQDIVEPTIISISSAECYVKIATASVTAETDWIFPQGVDYQRIPDEGEDLLRWSHIPSEIIVTLIFKQRTHPLKAYEYFILQKHLLEHLGEYEFLRINKASEEIIQTVRRISGAKTTLMISSTNELYIAFLKSADKSQAESLDKSLQRLNIPFDRVVGKEKEKTIKQIKVSPTESRWTLITDEPSLVEPIWLNERLFWLSKELKLEKPLTNEQLFALLRLKLNYEAQYGYDFLGLREERSLKSEEIWGFLFDFFTLRGDHMLDIGFFKGGFSVNLRFREKALKSANDILPEYLSQMIGILKEISTILFSN